MFWKCLTFYSPIDLKNMHPHRDSNPGPWNTVPMLSLFFVGNVIGREFDITNYGVCYLEDMLNEIPESSIGVSKKSTGTLKK